MRRRQTSSQSTLVSENEQPTPKGINFTYSENFNRVVELTTENYPDWRTNILYLLMIVTKLITSKLVTMVQW